MSATKADEVASSLLSRLSFFDHIIMSRKSAERLLLSLLPLLLQPLLEGKLLAVLPLPPTLSFQGGVQWRKSSASLSKPQKVPPHQACVPVRGTFISDQVNWFLERAKSNFESLRQMFAYLAVSSLLYFNIMSFPFWVNS